MLTVLLIIRLVGYLLMSVDIVLIILIYTHLLCIPHLYLHTHNQCLDLYYDIVIYYNYIIHIQTIFYTLCLTHLILIQHTSLPHYIIHNTILFNIILLLYSYSYSTSIQYRYIVYTTITRYNTIYILFIHNISCQPHIIRIGQCKVISQRL